MNHRLTTLPVALSAAALLMPALVAAEEPNIRPGMWESESVFSYEGNIPIPGRTVTSQECITVENVKEGFTFFDEDEMDGCDITHSELRRDGMDYTLSCKAEEVQLIMEGRMKFNGDSASGDITGVMDTPMGPVSMRIRMESRRVGDC
jgi:hypothetical protein